MRWIFNFLSSHVVPVINQPLASGYYKTQDNWNNPIFADEIINLYFFPTISQHVSLF